MIFTITDSVITKRDGKTGNHESDYIEECIGANGLWQICVTSIAALTRCIALFNVMSLVFLTPITGFLCVEFSDNATVEAEDGTCYGNCAKYIYHSEVMQSNLISDFGLICERAWLASFAQSILMFGVVLGVSLFGWISDRFGRRAAIISSTLLNIVSMLPTPFTTSYWSFSALRFVTGVASGGSYIVAIPVAMEIMGNRYREYAALCFFPDGFAHASLALFAYYLPVWKNYLLGLSVTSILIFILVCFVPESPRWLISHGKVDKAVKIMFGAAKVNKLSTDHIKDTVSRSVENMRIGENKTVNASYLDFFKDKRTIVITLSTFVIWFVIGVTYYGIYQYTTFIGSNVYLSVVTTGLIQVPLLLIVIALTKMMKRKTSLAAVLSTTGVTMIALIFTPPGHWSTTCLGVIGFSASAATYGVTYLYQAELYPTTLRNMSIGIGSAAGKIGSMLAPFIANLSPIWVPSLIFSVLSLVAVGFCLLLPETKGKNLKDTID